MSYSHLYRPIRKKYCEVLDYHPVNGGWERPVVMSYSEFLHNVEIEGENWWEWQIFNIEIPTLEEMVSEIEFVCGKITLDSISSCKRLVNPVFRIAKLNSKNGKQTIVRQYHLPQGNTFDSRITKQRANHAFQLIQSGMSVSHSIAKAGVNWNALKKYTPYIPVKSKIIKRVRDVIQLYQSGRTLIESLSIVGMSSKTFWKRTGGIKRVIQSTNPE